MNLALVEILKNLVGIYVHVYIHTYTFWVTYMSEYILRANIHVYAYTCTHIHT